MYRLPLKKKMDNLSIHTLLFTKYASSPQLGALLDNAGGSLWYWAAMLSKMWQQNWPSISGLEVVQTDFWDMLIAIIVHNPVFIDFAKEITLSKDLSEIQPWSFRWN